MEKIKVLVLEDDQTEIEQINNAKESYERAHEEVEFELFIFPSYNNHKLEILEKLLGEKIHFLIVDLRLQNDENGGNNFLISIQNNFHIPILINSSNRLELDEKFDQESNPLLKQFDPSDTTKTTEDMFLYMHEIYLTGVTHVLGKEGVIYNTLNKLIWNGYLQNLMEWQRYQDLDKSKNSLGRYALGHLYYDLGESSQDFHPEECYIRTDGTKIYTGTILSKATDEREEYFIVLNPACDLAQGNMDYLIITQIDIVDFSTEHDKLREKYKKSIEAGISEEEAYERARRSFNGMKKGEAKSQKYLPPSTLFKGGFINFSQITILKNSDLEDGSYKICCNVSMDFLKDIVSDFGTYLGRQGQPDLNCLL